VTTRGLPTWRRWLPRAGALASLFTTACCVGLPAAVSLVSAIGAGFLTQDKYLQPLLIVFIVVTVVASALTYWQHRNPIPLIVTVVAGVTIYWFIYRDYRVTLVWIGAVAMIAAQVWDIVAVRACLLRASRSILTPTP
jgi:uncharacterized membrane protein (UPF0136 family)